MPATVIQRRAAASNIEHCIQSATEAPYVQQLPEPVVSSYRGILRLLFSQDPLPLYLPYSKKETSVASHKKQYRKPKRRGNLNPNDEEQQALGLEPDENDSHVMINQWQSTSVLDFLQSASLVACFAISHHDFAWDPSTVGRRKRHAKAPYATRLFQRLREVTAPGASSTTTSGAREDVVSSSTDRQHPSPPERIALVLLVPSDLYNTLQEQPPMTSPPAWLVGSGAVVIPNSVAVQTVLGLSHPPITPSLSVLQIDLHTNKTPTPTVSTTLFASAQRLSLHPHEELALEWNEPVHVRRQWLEQRHSALTWWQYAQAQILFPSLSSSSCTIL